MVSMDKYIAESGHCEKEQSLDSEFKRTIPDNEKALLVIMYS